MIQNISSVSEFEQEVLSSSQTVLVDFFAPWCGPCQALLPILHKIGKNPPPNTKIITININESPELAQKFEIMSIPTLMVFKDAQLRDTFVGGGLREKDILDMMENPL